MSSFAYAYSATSVKIAVRLQVFTVRWTGLRERCALVSSVIETLFIVFLTRRWRYLGISCLGLVLSCLTTDWYL